MLLQSQTDECENIKHWPECTLYGRIFTNLINGHEAVPDFFRQPLRIIDSDKYRV